MHTIRLRGWIGGLTAAALLAGLSACNDASVPVPQSSWSPQSSGEPVDSERQPEDAQQPIPNDLARLPLKRTLQAEPLSVDAVYDTRLAVKDWRPDRSKPLHVSLKVVNKDDRKQKIYLTRVTANVTAFDDRGQIGDARSVSDTANINPGFIVTAPNTYNQSVALPTLDSSSLWMTIDLTYELVMEVDKTKEGRDFAKQVATDSITVPLGS